MVSRPAKPKLDEVVNAPAALPGAVIRLWVDDVELPEALYLRASNATCFGGSFGVLIHLPKLTQPPQDPPRCERAPTLLHYSLYNNGTARAGAVHLAA